MPPPSRAAPRMHWRAREAGRRRSESGSTRTSEEPLKRLERPKTGQPPTSFARRPGMAQGEWVSEVTEKIARIKEILANVRTLAIEYYKLTGKPLGVTGEIAEYCAAELLGLTLAPAREAGYDAKRGNERIQIKGRACSGKSGRLGRIKIGAPCDTVLLNIATMEPVEMWEAPYASVVERLSIPGKAHEWGALGIAEFKNLARQVWAADAPLLPASSSPMAVSRA